MKKLVLAAVLAAAASTANAGNLSDPRVDGMVKGETMAGSGGILLPLILLVVVGAAVAAG